MYPLFLFCGKNKPNYIFYNFKVQIYTYINIQIWFKLRFLLRKGALNLELKKISINHYVVIRYITL